MVRLRRLQEIWRETCRLERPWTETRVFLVAGKWNSKLASFSLARGFLNQPILHRRSFRAFTVVFNSVNKENRRTLVHSVRLRNKQTRGNARRESFVLYINRGWGRTSWPPIQGCFSFLVHPFVCSPADLTDSRSRGPANHTGNVQSSSHFG